ncbi:MAG: GNAT family N-acetyltransferase, partial [bacterium]
MSPDERIELEPLTILEQLDPHEIQFLEDRIYDYNKTQTGIDDARLLVITMRDQTGNLVAGLYGWTWGGCCEVKVLWVHEQLRGRGVGTRLMSAAEAEVRLRGGVQIILSTHDFQAPDFYHRLGFEQVAQIEDYPAGHRSIFLRKLLR